MEGQADKTLMFWRFLHETGGVRASLKFHDARPVPWSYFSTDAIDGKRLVAAAAVIEFAFLIGPDCIFLLLRLWLYRLLEQWNFIFRRHSVSFRIAHVCPDVAFWHVRLTVCLKAQGCQSRKTGSLFKVESSSLLSVFTREHFLGKR